MDHYRRDLRISKLCLQTLHERFAILHFLPVMSVFKVKTGQNLHRGYVANFRQESAAFIEVPRLAEKIPFIIVKRNGQDNTSVECKVNRARL